MTHEFLDSIVEQLRSPFLTIQIMAEAGETEAIRDVTSSSLRLLDDLQYLRDLKQMRLELSPVNLAAICDDIAHQLTPLAKIHNVALENHSVSSRPVLSHRRTLERAYENMARAILTMSSSGEDKSVILSTSGQGGTVRLGAYSSRVDIAAADLSRMRRLFGHTRRPLPTQSLAPLTELFIADNLLAALGSRMRTAISFHQRGLATTLMPSSQLSLVTL